MDEKLARGYARRLVNEVRRPSAEFYKKVTTYCRASKSISEKGSYRQFRKLTKENNPVVSIALMKRMKGKVTTHIVMWGCGETETEGYFEDNSLMTATLIHKVTRQGAEFKTFGGPLSISIHALARMIERDQTLPDYNLKMWLDHLTEATNVALVFTQAVPEDFQSIASLALPTKGGLFVSFLVPVNFYGNFSYEISARTFLGQHEMNEEEQLLHHKLLNTHDPEEFAGAHEEYGVEKLWRGKRPALIEKLIA